MPIPEKCSLSIVQVAHGARYVWYVIGMGQRGAISQIQGGEQSLIPAPILSQSSALHNSPICRLNINVYQPSGRVIRAKWGKKWHVVHIQKLSSWSQTLWGGTILFDWFTHEQMHLNQVSTCFAGDSLNIWRCTHIVQRICIWINIDVIWGVCMCRVKFHWL